MRCISVWLVAAAAALLWAGAVRAETPLRPAMFAAASAANARTLSAEQREERRFLKDAAAASRFETEASRMALVKSNNAAVRSFAATLINHHASTSIALQHMLHGRGMAAPMLANDQRKILNRLTKLGGVKFDREYTEQVALRYQQEGLQAYERASLTARDPALKAWLERILPTLRYHVAGAERLATDRKQDPVQANRKPGNSSKARGTDLTAHFMGAGPVQMGVAQPFASVSSIR